MIFETQNLIASMFSSSFRISTVLPVCMPKRDVAKLKFVILHNKLEMNKEIILEQIYTLQKLKNCRPDKALPNDHTILYGNKHRPSQPIDLCPKQDQSWTK